MTLQYCQFAVDESPHCVWDWELRTTNLRLIQGIDPGYFEYQADSYQALTSMDDPSDIDIGRAALSLRSAYVHGLETLFALLFATVQAPDCVIGWLNRYQPGILRSLITKANMHQSILTKLDDNEPVTWESISRTIFSAASIKDDDKRQRIQRSFAKLWQRFANEFMEESLTSEYNSIKHGLRVKSGGVSVNIGREEVPGTPAPRENMRPLGGSRFGTSSFRLIPIKDRKWQFKIQERHINWVPENLIYGLYLIAYSLQNIRSFLIIDNGGNAQDQEFTWPSDEADFEGPWQMHSGVLGLNVSETIPAKIIPSLTKEEILQVYSRDSQHD